jgi:hypothetical protein
MELRDTYYTAVIAKQILALLFDKECDNYIGLEELEANGNATDFVHAMSCATAIIYKEITKNECDFLEFNHIANRLIFQYSKLSDKVREV